MTSSERPDTRQTYQDGKLYKAETICAQATYSSPEYANRLLARKLEIVASHHRPGLTLDLCCATGGHMFDMAEIVTPAIGIDFSIPFIAKARDDANARGLKAMYFATGDAKALPLAAGAITTLYCLSALYVIPDAGHVFTEIARVLKPGGRAILDLGNVRSLNAFSVSHYTELPRQYFQTPGEMHLLIASAGLVVVEHRAFQILPLWADRPSWLWPLLHPFWKRILSKRFQGKMLDEWLSNLPLLKSFAFRHILVCEKPTEKGQ